MIAAYWECNGHQVFINELVEDFRIIKQQNILVCNSQTAYAIIFVNGLSKESIDDAGILARRIINNKIKSFINQGTALK